MKTTYPPKSLLRPSRRTKRKISLLEIFLMAVETLWSNKIRSGLTMLGVIIGISSVIAITSIGQGVQRATELRIEALGTNILQVSAAAARTGGISQGAGTASTLTWENARSLAEPLGTRIAKQVPAATAFKFPYISNRLNCIEIGDKTHIILPQYVDRDYLDMNLYYKYFKFNYVLILINSP